MQLRIKISDADIDAFLEKQRQKAGGKVEYNIAQILVTVPENATGEVVNERRLRAEAALARIKAGEAFETVALEVSEDPSKVNGGAMGLRPLDRWPDVFAESVKDLQPGEVSPTVPTVKTRESLLALRGTPPRVCGGRTFAACGEDLGAIVEPAPRTLEGRTLWPSSARRGLARRPLWPRSRLGSSATAGAALSSCPRLSPPTNWRGPPSPLTEHRSFISARRASRGRARPSRPR